MKNAKAQLGVYSASSSELHSLSTPSGVDKLSRDSPELYFRAFALSLFRAFVPSCLRAFAPSRLRAFAPSRFRAFAPSRFNLL
jgi:hypothetical protein